MLQPDISRKSSSSTLEKYSLPSDSLVSSRDLRLDAAHYNPELFDAIHTLRKSGMRVERLADITDRVFIPPRFKRIYVDNPSNGVPFLQGSHIVHFHPADIKYLSKKLHNLEKWTIHEGWVLVTCSGTIGRSTIALPEWDGWSASQHILRIVPDESKCPSGYLCSFLASRLGQIQLTANIYGAVVDEITEKQARTVLVPLPKEPADAAIMRSVDDAMKESMRLKSRAVASTMVSIGQLSERFDDGGPETDLDSIGHQGKDLRIQNTTPEELAKTLMSGGAKPRSETKGRKAS